MGAPSEVLDELSDFLPADFPLAEVGGCVLVEGTFDRASGQVLLAINRAGVGCVLTRPNSFELFRALPCAEKVPFALGSREGEPMLQVRVFDRVLAMTVSASTANAIRGLLAQGSGPVRVLHAKKSGSQLPRIVEKTPTATPQAEVAVPRPRKSRPSLSVPAEVLRDAERELAEARGESRRLAIQLRTQQARAKEEEAIRRRVEARKAEAEKAEKLRLELEAEQLRAQRARLDAERTKASTVVDTRTPLPVGPDTIHPPTLQTAPGQRRFLPAPSSRVREDETPLEPIDTLATSSVRPPSFQLQPLPVVRGAHDLPALRATLRHHWERGALDECVQVAHVLAALDAADDTAARLASLHPPIAPSPGQSISPMRFRELVTHPQEPPELGRFMSLLWPALIAMRLRPERELGLRSRHEVDFARPVIEYPRTFQALARSLGVPLPRLWVRDDVQGGLAHLNVSPVGSLCGGSLLSHFTHEETLFVTAHHLSFYRPEAYVFALLPSRTDVLMLVSAALYLNGFLPPDRNTVELAERLDRFIVAPNRQALREACAELHLQGDPRSAMSGQLLAFRRAAHMTAVRAGMVFTGSLAVASKMVHLMPPTSGITHAELFDDLVRFAASPEWTALRRDLGIALPASSPGMPLP